MRQILLIAISTVFVFVSGGLRADEKSTSSATQEPGVVDKAEKAVVRGAKAAASGIERGVDAAAKGIKRGATATGDFIERGAKATARGVERGVTATGNAIDKAARKLETKQEPAPVR